MKFRIGDSAAYKTPSLSHTLEKQKKGNLFYRRHIYFFRYPPLGGFSPPPTYTATNKQHLQHKAQAKEKLETSIWSKSTNIPMSAPWCLPASLTSNFFPQLLGHRNIRQGQHQNLASISTQTRKLHEPCEIHTHTHTLKPVIACVDCKNVCS